MDAEAIIRGELSPSESLLWAGRPRLGLLFHAKDAYFIPFGVLFLGCSVYWCFGVVAQGDPIGLVVGIPFVLVGLYFAFGRFFVDRWLRSHVAYGISSDRVIIVSEWLSRRVRSLCLETLTDLSLTERANGAGRITFGPSPAHSGYNGPAGWPDRRSIPMFDLAENARQVYETVRDARRAAIRRVN